MEENNPGEVVIDGVSPQFHPTNSPHKKQA